MSDWVFADPKKGDKFIVRDGHNKLLSLRTISRVTDTEISQGAIRFKRRNGIEVGGVRFARPADEATIAAAEAELHQKELDRQAEEDRKRQAEYDALPEAVKLARSLRWLCDCESEETVATAPIEHLRGMVEWARARKLTTE